MSYTVSEILKSVIGLDEYGKPKTAVAFNISKVDEITGMREEKSSAQVCNAKIRIIKVSDFITIDLIFANKYASELNKFWSIIELYGEEITNREDLNADIPVAGALTIVPVAFQGKIFISAVNPIYWTLMPSTPADEINTVRLLFKARDMLFLEGEEFDVDALRESIELEIKKEDAAVERMLQRMEEDEEYEESRNQLIESMRNTVDLDETILQKRLKKEEEESDDINE